MSNGFLLDTVTVSEATRKSLNPGVASWLKNVDEEQTYISVLTVGEIQKGIEKLDAHSVRRNDLERWLVSDLIGKFGRRVLAFDIRAARLWGTFVTASLRRGITMPIVDSQIAATAAANGLTVITRNIKDFSEIGVPTVNPWV